MWKTNVAGKVGVGLGLFHRALCAGFLRALFKLFGQPEKGMGHVNSP